MSLSRVSRVATLEGVRPVRLRAAVLCTCLALIAPAVAFAQDAAAPEPLQEADGPTIGYDTVAHALAAVKADPKARVVSDWAWTTYEIGTFGQPGYVLWSFSPADHPAHQSAVKRTVALRDGRVIIDMDVAWEAAKPACDQMVRDFEALTVALQNALDAPHAP